MSVRTDVINLNVNINGDKAKADLNALRSEAAKITAEMRNLKKGSDEWIQKNKELTAVKSKIADLRKEIGITALSQRELVAELKRLNAIKLNLTPQTAEFKELQKQIDAVQGRLKDVRTGEFGFKKFWSSISAEVKQFGMLAAGYLGFDFVIGQTKNIIKMQTSLADQYANIEKTSSLTKEEIKELDVELRKLETRTSNSRLRDLAAEAGKLGKDGVKDIRAFVEEADKIEVALGEDLGEEGLMKIAKLSGILKEGMLNIASGINAVGAASAASEPYQVDFAFRMAGTAQTARISAGDLLGYAAALEVNGQTAEVAGTSMSTFMMDFIKNSEQFGKAAGYAKGELTELIANEGVNRGFLDWLKRMKDMSATEADFMRSMESIGINGARGAGVFLVLANNLEMVAEQQRIANQAVAEGTSVIDEFNTKNQNFAAIVDKIGKEFNSFFTSDAVNKGVVWLTMRFTDLLHAMSGMAEWISKNKAAMLAWTGAAIIQSGVVQKLVAWLALQVTGTRAATLAQVANTIATKADIAATAALGVVKALLVGNITKLRQELKLLTVALSTNPWTALLVAIGAVIVVMGNMLSSTEKLTAAQKVALDIEKRVADSVASRTTKVNNLVEAIKSENTTNEDKKRLMKELIALDPTLLQGLNSKNIATSEGEKIIRNYIKALEDAVKAEALFSLQVDAEKKVRELEREMKKYDKMFASYNNGAKGVAKAIWDVSLDMVGLGPLGEWDELKEQYDEALAYKAELQKEANSTAIAPRGLNGDDKPLVGGAGASGSGASGGSNSEADNKIEKLEQLRKEAEKLAVDIKKRTASASDDLSALQAIEIKELTDMYAEKINKAKKLSVELAKELTDLRKEDIDLLINKQFIQRQEKEYNDAIALLNQYTTNARNTLDKDYADGIISRDTYNKELSELTKKELESRIKIATQYKPSVKAAEKDLQDAQTEVVKKGISDRDALLEKSERSKKAAADLKVAAAPENTVERLNALKEQLTLERDMKLKNADLTNEEIDLINEEHRNATKELDMEFWKTKADLILNVFAKLSDGLAAVFKIANNRDEAQLNAEKKRNEERTKVFKRQLDAKRISEAQYNKEVEKMNAQVEAKELEMRRKKAQRDKAQAIFGAIINTATAVATALTAGPVVGAILAALYGAIGLAQVVAIKSEPLPIARKGLVINGPSHESGGIDLVNNQTGERIAEMEGGEPIMILSKNTYRNNKAVVDELLHNSQHKNGAAIKTNWYMKPQRAFNNEAVKVMSDDYINIATSQRMQQQQQEEVQHNNALMAQMIEEQRMTRQAIGQIKNIKAYVAYRDMEESKKLVDRAKELSGIK